MNPREEMLRDVLTTAVEGGTGYWASVSEYKWDTEDADQVGATLHEMVENDPDAAWDWSYRDIGARLNLYAIEQAMVTMARGDHSLSGMCRTALINPASEDVDFDADDADVITQMVLLGEVVYG